MPASAHDWTVEQLHALPDDGNRYEIVDGELLVSAAPVTPHQRAVRELIVLLHAYLGYTGMYEALLAPTDVRRGTRTNVQPDVFVYATTRETHDRFVDLRSVILAAEVLSPSTARADRHTKRLLYQREGVAEYWIVDLDARIIERWHPGDERPEIVDERLAWQAPEIAQPLVIDVPAFFARVLRRPERE